MPAPQTYTEKELLKRIAEDDEASFRELFHRYNALLLPFATKLTGAVQGREEVLQEVFLKIWQHRHKLPLVDHPKAWIIRVTSNEATNYMQQLARQNRLMSKAQSQSQSIQLTPDQLLAAKETARLIAKAIEKLTPACRQVYLLSREQYLSISEIAQMLSVSENTVKNQLVKSLKDIRRYIRETDQHTFFTFPILF